MQWFSAVAEIVSFKKSYTISTNQTHAKVVFYFKRLIFNYLRLIQTSDLHKKNTTYCISTVSHTR